MIKMIDEVKFIRQIIYDFFEDIYINDLKLPCDNYFKLSVIEKYTQQLTEKIESHFETIKEFDYHDILLKLDQVKEHINDIILTLEGK